MDLDQDCAPRSLLDEVTIIGQTVTLPKTGRSVMLKLDAMSRRRTSGILAIQTKAICDSRESSSLTFRESRILENSVAMVRHLK
jgi:hypothetical protein